MTLPEVPVDKRPTASWVRLLRQASVRVPKERHHLRCGQTCNNTPQNISGILSLSNNANLCSFEHGVKKNSGSVNLEDGTVTSRSGCVINIT